MMEYSFNDLTVYSPEQIMLRNLPVFNGERVTAESLCIFLKKDVEILGVNSMSYFYRDGWWYICSEIDWFFLSSHKINSAEELFKHMHPFPEKGRNACRLESYIWALSNSVYTISNGQFISTLKGLDKKLDFFQNKISIKNYERIIVFRDFK